MENKLPEGWEWKKLGEVSDIIMGQSPSGETYNENGNGMPFLQGKAEFTDSCPKHVKYTTSPSKIAPEGSILISVRAPVGDVNIANLEYCIGRGLASISLKNGDNKFLFYLLRYLKPEIESKGTGSTFKAISKSILHDLIIPLPPLETQQKIVSILEKAEETKKLRAQADELTQKLLQSVFLEMFGDPVTNPMGWNTEKLKKLCVKIFGGGTPSKSKPEYYEGNVPWVTPKDMKQDFIQDSIDHISEQAIEESSTKLIPPNSLLMVIRSGILKKKLPVAINSYEVTMNQDMKSFVFDNKLTKPFFMLHYFKIFQRDLLNRVRSVTADNLEFNQIKDIDVILPPIEQQQRFATIVEQLERTKSNQQKSSLEIDNLFDALMQKAFTGKLVS
ncbi:Type I restriction-modification system, specificity subunit S [Methanosarcina siciliae C2J]|uniref:Type I restriction-modification system, specificity subunit S n=1 Tax=Methanosarcina siciliae C2J TaxID=1434118 RepID=A0A0E3PQ41_9EURY|nr:restriction endonuclease subunit S [Methanosarcina siciliae]AKB36697.1 Type I restriction-modification system, specificity subunit S [Methanosarcina siciliae C2J]